MRIVISEFMASNRRTLRDEDGETSDWIEIRNLGSTAENLSGWFKAGVCAVGMGSKLITKASLENRDYEGIRKGTEKSLELIREVRGK